MNLGPGKGKWGEGEGWGEWVSPEHIIPIFLDKVHSVTRDIDV